MDSLVKRRPIHPLNQNDIVKWSGIIGNLVIYQGTIEFISLQWILALSKDIILHDTAVDLQFRKELALSELCGTRWLGEGKEAGGQGNLGGGFGIIRQKKQNGSRSNL